MSDFKNELTWSKSRDALFRECRRAYYYQHYGAWGGWESNAPTEVRELYLMKQLNNRATWPGIVVHEVAERLMRGLQQGRPWSEDAALQEAEARMREELRLSQSGGYRRGLRVMWAGKRIKTGGLQEHYYQMAVEAEEWEETIQHALRCIRTLYASVPLRRLLARGASAVLSVEELESFPVDGVPVWVKLDLAVRGREEGVVIVDWKTGAAHVAEDISLQLGIYGLYGTRKWGISAEQIQGFDVNLRDGSMHRHPIDAQVLVDVERYIQKSIDQMRAILQDPATNRAEINDFPLTDKLERCARCNFRRACARETSPATPPSLEPHPV